MMNFGRMEVFLPYKHFSCSEIKNPDNGAVREFFTSDTLAFACGVLELACTRLLLT